VDAETTWTWVLFAFEVVGVTGMWLVGRKLWWAWAIVLVHSVPWLAYSLIYAKPAFVAMSLCWWVVNFVNMRKWKRELVET